MVVLLIFSSQILAISEAKYFPSKAFYLFVPPPSKIFGTSSGPVPQMPQRACRNKFHDEFKIMFNQISVQLEFTKLRYYYKVLHLINPNLQILGLKIGKFIN